MDYFFSTYNTFIDVHFGWFICQSLYQDNLVINKSVNLKIKNFKGGWVKGLLLFIHFMLKSCYYKCLLIKWPLASYHFEKWPLGKTSWVTLLSEFLRQKWASCLHWPHILTHSLFIIYGTCNVTCKHKMKWSNKGPSIRW